MTGLSDKLDLNSLPLALKYFNHVVLPSAGGRGDGLPGLRLLEERPGGAGPAAGGPEGGRRPQEAADGGGGGAAGRAVHPRGARLLQPGGQVSQLTQL